MNAQNLDKLMSDLPESINNFIDEKCIKKVLKRMCLKKNT